MACDFAAAARWGEKAALTPGAHHLIAMIAAAACGLAGEEAQARRWATAARAKRQDATLADFMQAFPIRDDSARQAITGALRRQGF